MTLNVNLFVIFSLAPKESANDLKLLLVCKFPTDYKDEKVQVASKLLNGHILMSINSCKLFPPTHELMQIKERDA